MHANEITFQSIINLWLNWYTIIMRILILLKQAFVGLVTAQSSVLLISSLDTDNREAVCPNERVELTCHVAFTKG